MIEINGATTIITTVADLISPDKPVDIWNIEGSGLDEVQTKFEKCNQWIHIDKDGHHKELKLRFGVIQELRIKYGTANDPLIAVCDKCSRAACWQGEFMCDGAKSASVKDMLMSELKKLNLEHPSYWHQDCAVWDKE